jgi:hypothetical protein
MRLEPFTSWAAFLSFVRAGGPVKYQAPLDRHATNVVITQVYKNGKVRVRGGGMTFTADAGHLPRFRRWAAEPSDTASQGFRWNRED